MTMGILGTAVSGLKAFQRSLETTSHNIANVNTEGYSRQRVELATLPAQFRGSGYMGNGVNVENITRSYDQFVTNQLRSSSSAFGEMDEFHKLASQIDNILADETTGMSPALKSFFNAVNDVASDPSSTPARQVMLSEANQVSQQFGSVNTKFSQISAGVNKNLELTVKDINTLASDIADLNKQIVSDINRTAGQRVPNDLLDERDLLIARVSEKVDVSVLDQADGSVSVFIGKGQPLVLANNSSIISLSGSEKDPQHLEVFIDGQNASREISGGELKGLLRFRDEVLEPARLQLGLVATGLAVEFNTLHETGFDLEGTAGTALFSFGATEIDTKKLGVAPGAITASFQASVAGLSASDYQLDYDGTNYTLTQLSDNTTTTFTAGGTTTLSGPGFDISTAGMVSGSSFFLRPTYDAAKNINVAIDDPRKIAASASAATVPGDNENALKLARLETQSILNSGTATITDAYTQLISDVGSLTHSAQVGRAAQETLLNQAQASRENISGVNLDEEAANLIKFQNSYQAAAQAVAVASSMFDALIGAVR
jgi:flagellar hook-associated protein 1 FlgK